MTGASATAALVLAAGASSRMGRPKALLEIGGRTLVARAADAAREAGLAPVIVVLGSDAAALRESLRGARAALVENAAWATGMASSIRCGVAALPEEAEAVVLLPCDQPAVSADLLARLVALRRERGLPMAACRYAGALGPPALFARERFGELLALGGDEGARGLLRRAPESVAVLDFPEGAFDVDTPEDWARWEHGSRS